VWYNYPTSGVGSALRRLANTASASSPSDSQKFAEYTYLGAGAVVEVKYPAVQVSSNPLVLTYGTGGMYGGLDRFGRVVDQRWKIATANTVKDQFKYAYDLASNRISRQVGPDMASPPTGLDEYYLYDELQRLMKVNRGNLSSGTITDANAGFSQAWAAWDTDHWASSLDALGNWPLFKQDDNGGGSGDSGWELSQTRLHNKVNEIDNNNNHADAPSGSISGGSWVLPVQDAAGNMTAGPKPGTEGTRHWYIWDGWNRLVAVWQDDGDGTKEITGEDPDDTLVATYRYDGQNRRIRKLLGTDPDDPDTAYDYYYNETWQMLEVRKDGSANSFEQFVWDVRYINAPVVRFRDGNTDGDLVDEGDNTLYYTNDANMNVTSLVEPDGDVVERYAYDPYGKVTVLDPDFSADADNKSDFDNTILYCGYFFDDESGLYQVRERYLHVTLGRWLLPDSLEYHDGMNMYQYAAGCPGVALDPYGTGTIKVDFSVPSTVPLLSLYVRGELTWDDDCVKGRLFGGAEVTIPGLDKIKKALEYIRLHSEFYIRGMGGVDVSYCKCGGGCLDAAICIRLEVGARIEFRSKGVQELGARKRFERNRFGAAGEGSGEACYNLCSGDLTLELNASFNVYANVGFWRFNRTYSWEKAWSLQKCRLATLSYAPLKQTGWCCPAKTLPDCF